MVKTVTLDEEQLATLKALAETADALSTAVVSGRTNGAMKLALDVARALNDIKRKKVLG
jgi:hypothetical protein